LNFEIGSVLHLPAICLSDDQQLLDLFFLVLLSLTCLRVVRC